MPDAMSKTVPIWCAVINAWLFRDQPGMEDAVLHTPPVVVSATEHSQIAALIPSFLASLKALGLDEKEFSRRLTKPLRPMWVTQETPLSGDGSSATFDSGIFKDFHPVICCTASRRVDAGAEMDAGGYIQGAGDDTENWARGLTPDMFWKNKNQFLSIESDMDLQELVDKLVRGKNNGKTDAPDEAKLRLVAPRIFVCSLPLGISTSKDGPGLCHVVFTPNVSGKETWIKSPRLIEVGIGKHKVASRNLRLALPVICAFVHKQLHTLAGSEEGVASVQNAVVTACESGKDLSVGTALAILCWCFDVNGKLRPLDCGDTSFNKDFIRSRLGSIMVAFPEANPSRAVLQSVNSFLMDWRR
jgi:tRNA A64-2'-O-ribosylphosphate transferase